MVFYYTYNYDTTVFMGEIYENLADVGRSWNSF